MTSAELVVFFSFVFITCVQTFNLDVKFPHYFTGVRNNSAFGQSVAIYTSKKENWLLIGAPTDNNDGAVYKCKYLNSSGTCEKIEFNPELSTTDVPENYGATVRLGNSKELLVCAPGFTQVSGKHYDMYGLCYLLTDFTKTKKSIYKYKPCEIRSINNHGNAATSALCQAGFSAAFTFKEQTTNLIMGAPGMVWNQGSILKFEDLYENHNTLPKLHTGEMQVSEGTDLKNLTEEDYLTQSYDSNLLGYSLATGSLGNNKGMYVAGAPRRMGFNFLGSVVIFDETLRAIEQINGEQFGEYFGASVAVADVNGDGLDDVIVGSPLYSNLVKGLHESGKITILYQSVNSFLKSKFEVGQVITGNMSLSRFGQSIVNVGDVNQDGFEDVLVSAPYASHDLSDDHKDDITGAIFLFNGGRKGLLTTPSQTISAKDLFLNNNITMKGFGYGMSGNKDLDKNGYPDVLIGAYQSSNAVVFRARPIISVDIKITSSVNNVVLDKKECVIGAMRTSCFIIQTCFSYTGSNVPSNVDIQFKYDVDFDKKDKKRTFLNGGYERNLTLIKDEQNCVTELVYVQNNIRDKLSPFIIDIEYSLREQNIEVEPVLNALSPTSGQIEVKIFKDCGSDDICQPDLNHQVTLSPEIVTVNSKTPVLFEAFIINNAEPAYLTSLAVEYPPFVSFVDLVQKSTFSCFDNSSFVICEIANPLARSSNASIALNFEFNDYVGNATTRQFRSYVNSTNIVSSQIKFAENAIHMNVISEVEIKNSSVPDRIYIESKDENSKENLVKPIKHRYEITNAGPADIETAEIYLYWPLKYDDDSFDLSLIELKHSPEIDCPTNLKVNKSEASGSNVLVPNDESNFNYYNCHTYPEKCRMVKCVFHNLSKSSDDTVLYIELEAGVHLDKLIKSEKDSILTSSFRLEVTKIPYLIANETKVSFKSEANTYVLHQPPPSLPIWIIIVVSIIGAIILFLLLLILPLWKCGFFRRKRIPSSRLLEHQAQRQRLVNPSEDTNDQNNENK